MKGALTIMHAGRVSIVSITRRLKMEKRRKVEITPDMIEIGEATYLDLKEAGVSSAYLVEQVYQAMAGVRIAYQRQRPSSAQNRSIRA
jgi:hypothetical protein